MGKSEYYANNMEMDVCVCSVNTGEVLHEFKGLDLLLGEQYWTAWCVGQYYRIVETTKKIDFRSGRIAQVIYWVK